MPCAAGPLNRRQSGLSHTQVVQNLGSGSFGTVRLVKELGTDKMLAMKILNRRDASKYVEAEIVNHSLLRHPHIVHFREVGRLAEAQ